ncbi:MAG: DUF2288 domain-containing protein [Gammaproteobacteria bacterium]|nr:DUF2288 domain-containing protein [Gammaproteobacteria bacterium]
MSDETPIRLSEEELRQKINLETGKLSWGELQRHFARGVVIVIDGRLDLVDVAFAFTSDDKPQVENWMGSQLIRIADDEDAHLWQETHAHFWSVVVAPWVLVQAIIN